MIYKLKTNNFCDFSKFKDNVLAPRSYFIPFENIEKLKETDIRNERFSSSLATCISGKWDFKYYADSSDVPDEFDTDKIEFDNIHVPSTWQHTGYEKPYYVNTRYQFKPNPPKIPIDCPVGIYRKIIEIDDEKLNFTLCFLGVAGSLELFVNGKYVGYSEGSHNTAEFEINDYIAKGRNEIIVQNHKWSNGTYLECQDMFRCNGIFRDVILFKTESNSIYDFEAKTSFSGGGYLLDVIPTLKLTDECELSAALYDGGVMICSKSVNVSPSAVEKLAFDALDVNEWSAERPYLYSLIITLSKGGKIIEVIRKEIGFKHIEIKGNVFYFNNKPIKLLGVNHHDTNPKTGYVLSVEDMERDISTIKRYNANCIRTSHYPPDPTFLDLCDEYGIYVVDEADIETHGCETELKKPGACSHNTAWQGHYIDRVMRMFERDKNHPSITMWSLGNEAHGYKNQDYCYERLKKLTPIPIHYEGVCRTRRWAYDVLSQMYTWHGICEKIAAGKGLTPRYYKKPFFLCEYAHAMGVGAGELERYIKCFYSAENMMGGCIWEFADHAAYHESGEYKYTYGGDHGEEKHDSNFCVDGLFFPDRTPHSGAKQMKVCYRPVRERKISENKFEFFNHKYFENSEFTVKYNYLSDGIVQSAGAFELNIAPQCAQTIEIGDVVFDKTRHNTIVFEYFDGDFSVAKTELELSAGELKESIDTSGKITVNTSENKLFISFENGSMIFDKATGYIQSYIYGGREMINQFPISGFKGFSLQLYRAPLDNDMYINKIWRKAHLESLISVCKGSSFTENGNSVIITSRLKGVLPGIYSAASVDVKYTVYPSGQIKAEYYCCKGGNVKLVPRFGVQLEMPREFDSVTYYGRGSDVNLPDFKEHTVNGIYKTTVSKMREDYIKPQESAVRCDVRFCEITNEDGFGLRFEALEKPFVFATCHYTPQMCAKALHREDLTDMPTTCVNIDAAHMGAGSNSCGPVPSKQYRLGKLKGKRLAFLIKPLG